MVWSIQLILLFFKVKICFVLGLILPYIYINCIRPTNSKSGLFSYRYHKSLELAFKTCISLQNNISIYGGVV